MLAAFSGSVLYMARRGTGLRRRHGVLHGVWDMSAFLVGVNDDSGVFVLLPMLLLAVAVFFVATSLIRLSRPGNGRRWRAPVRFPLT